MSSRRRPSLLLWMFLIAVLISCSTPLSLVPEKKLIVGYDFTKYSDAGFLFTPNEYTGAYESVGLINLIYTPRAELVEVYAGYSVDGAQPIMKKAWKAEKYDSEMLLDMVYESCVELGANAFTQMEINAYEETHGGNTLYPVKIDGAKISGFAIKRIGEEYLPKEPVVETPPIRGR